MILCLCTCISITFRNILVLSQSDVIHTSTVLTCMLFHRRHIRCPASVCPCACVWQSHFLGSVTHSYVLQATHAFTGMLPFWYIHCGDRSWINAKTRKMIHAWCESPNKWVYSRKPWWSGYPDVHECPTWLCVFHSDVKLHQSQWSCSQWGAIAFFRLENIFIVLLTNRSSKHSILPMTS